MPGKVNPVIPEAVAMAAAQVIGADAAITVGGLSGNFELNVMKPVIAHNLLSALSIVANVVRLFTEKCVKGIKANRDIAEGFIEKSLAMCTALAPKLGYDKAAEVAKEAYASGKTVRQVVLEKKMLPEKELAALLNARAMTEPGMTLDGAGG